MLSSYFKFFTSSNKRYFFLFLHRLILYCVLSCCRSWNTKLLSLVPKNDYFVTKNLHMEYTKQLLTKIFFFLSHFNFIHFSDSFLVRTIRRVITYKFGLLKIISKIAFPMVYQLSPTKSFMY